MDGIPDEAFDAVVCYGGPFSYVFERAGHAMQECRRVLKPGGLLLSSVMSLWGTVHAFFGGVVDVPPDFNRQIIRTGDLTPETQTQGGHYCHLYRSDEYRLLHERSGFKVLCMSASNGLATNWGQVLDRCRADPVLWEHVLEMELAACAESGYLDGGTHILVVARKVYYEGKTTDG
jgi:SAM-dependent methyltransferase